MFILLINVEIYFGIWNSPGDSYIPNATMFIPLYKLYTNLLLWCLSEVVRRRVPIKFIKKNLGSWRLLILLSFFGIWPTLFRLSIKSNNLFYSQLTKLLGKLLPWSIDCKTTDGIGPRKRKKVIGSCPIVCPQDIFPSAASLSLLLLPFVSPFTF